MSGRRYGDPCGVARALDLVGERWALLVVRELLLGPKRFADLRIGLPAISPNVLSQRLAGLEQRGIVRHRTLGPPVSAAVYELTEVGTALEPVLVALAHWGGRALPAEEGELSVDALALALRTTVRRGHQCPTGTYLLRFPTDQLSATVDDTGLVTVERGNGRDPMALITATVAALRSVVFGGVPVSAALASRYVAISGRTSAGRAFLAHFERPALYAERNEGE